jgi:hypothetical protein
MKNSVTFIVSFIVSVSVFSPLAVANQSNFPSKLPKPCKDLNTADFVVAPPQAAPQKPQPNSGPVIKGQV